MSHPLKPCRVRAPRHAQLSGPVPPALDALLCARLLDPARRCVLGANNFSTADCAASPCAARVCAACSAAAAGAAR